MKLAILLLALVISSPVHAYTIEDCLDEGECELV
jgi:hypothetical protein